MDDIKTDKNKISFKKKLNESNQNNNEVDTAAFDKTLREIEKTLKILEQKLGTNQDLLRKNEIIKEEIVAENKVHGTIKEETIDENKEHKISKSLLPMEDLHDYKINIEEKKKKYFGFYGYLFLIIAIFFTTYAILNVSKDLIILKYPVTENTIQYFYEVLAILKFVVFNIFSFIKNVTQIK